MTAGRETTDWAVVGIEFTMWMATVIGAFFALRFAIKDLAERYERMGYVFEKLADRVDQIGTTVSEIKQNAARHDQRAQDIERMVDALGERLTFIERR